MQSEIEREQAEQKQTAEPPAVPKKRFRVEKLEERIAPHLNPHGKLVGHTSSSTSQDASGSIF